MLWPCETKEFPAHILHLDCNILHDKLFIIIVIQIVIIHDKINIIVIHSYVTGPAKMDQVGTNYI